MGVPANGQYGFYRLTSPDEDHVSQTLIYSTLNSLVLASDSGRDPDAVVVSPDENLLVQATNVTLRGSFKMPGKKIVIIARKITVQTEVVIDVSATDKSQTEVPNLRTGNKTQKPPAEHAQDADWGLNGDPGDPKRNEPGYPGGAITLRAEEIELGASLVLKADGGQGGRGQDGMDGTPGAPGSYRSTIVVLESVIHPRQHTEESGTQQRAGKGGDGGNPAPGGRGGVCGSVTVEGHLSNAGHLQTSLKGGLPGRPGEIGKAAPNGDPPGGHEYGRADPFGRHIDRTDNLSLSDLVPKNGVAPTGGYNNEGSQAGATNSAEISAGPPDLGNLLDASFLLMLFQEVRSRMVLAGPPAPPIGASDEWKMVGNDLAWLSGVLGKVKSTDASTEAKRKQLLAPQVRALLSHHRLSRNINGRPADWTPWLILDVLQKALDEAKQSYGAVARESQAALGDMQKYWDDLRKDSSKRDALATALARSEATIRLGNDNITSLGRQLGDSDMVMEALQLKLQEDEDALARMKDKFNCPKPEQIFKAAEMLAFSPEAPMALTQVGELLYDGYTKLQGLNGAVNKKYAFEELNTLGENLIGDGQIVLARGTEGKLGLRGMVTTLERYKEKLQNVEDAIGTEVTKTLETVKALDVALQARAPVLGRYNAAVQAVIAAERGSDFSKNHLDQLKSSESASANPLRSGILQLLSHQLQRQRENLLQQYMETRAAFSFRYLLDPEEDDLSWAKDAIAGQGVSPVQTIGDKITQMHNLEPKGLETLGPLKRAPGNAYTPSDIQIRIDLAKVGADLAEQFFKEKRFGFYLSDKADPAANIFRPDNIFEKGNLRVFRVRPRLLGIKDVRKVIMTCTQGGNSRFVTADTDRTFEHAPMTFSFTWDANSRPRDFGSGSDGSWDVSKNFIMASLFGHWELAVVPDEANEGLDLRQVTQIQIEFGCEYHERLS